MDGGGNNGFGELGGEASLGERFRGAFRGHARLDLFEMQTRHSVVAKDRAQLAGEDLFKESELVGIRADGETRAPLQKTVTEYSVIGIEK